MCKIDKNKIRNDLLEKIEELNINLDNFKREKIRDFIILGNIIPADDLMTKLREIAMQYEDLFVQDIFVVADIDAYRAIEGEQANIKIEFKRVETDNEAVKRIIKKYD
jgi:hypothetical protein